MNSNRRQFLQLLGTSAAAGAGLTQRVTAQETPVVKMGNNYFDPIGLHVEPGTTVQFEIAAGAHSATAYQDRIPDGAKTFDSGVISEGSFKQTFDTPGTYDYYCSPHQSVGMVGRIVVGEPGGPAEQSPIPNGDVPSSDRIVDRETIAYEAFADGDSSSSGGMMGPGMGPGMGSGRGRGWFGGLPFVGGALGMLGVIGGALYWALRRGQPSSEQDNTAMATLRNRHERGEISDEEFQRRRNQLETTDGNTSK